MLKTGGAVLVALMMAVMPQSAQAQDVSAALERIDEIIAEMQAMRAEVAALAASASAPAPTPTVLGASSGGTLTEDLSYGATNDDIARIQRLLATDPEIYDHPHITGFFGPKTQEAIQNFQIRFGLDPVGVIGPSTRALLEVFLSAYPNENYPAGVLDKKPTGTVAGASTSVTPAPVATTPTVSTPAPVTNNPASYIEADVDRGEARVEVEYANGNDDTFTVTGDTEDEIIEAIADRTILSESQVRAVIEFDGDSLGGGSSDDDDEEEEAEDALDDAEDAIDEAEDAIDDADSDENTNWAEDTLDEAEDKLDEAEDAYDDGDYEEAIELAEEAEELAEEAEDRIGDEEGSEKGDSDDIDEIEAEVDEDETEVTVKYDNADDYVFTVEEDKTDEIIEEVADELDIDEDDVEDVIEFDFGDIDEIEVDVDLDEDEAKVVVTYETGVERKFTIDADDDEDEMIEDIAKEIDEDEDDVEDLTDFDY